MYDVFFDVHVHGTDDKKYDNMTGATNRMLDVIDHVTSLPDHVTYLPPHR